MEIRMDEIVGWSAESGRSTGGRLNHEHAVLELLCPTTWGICREKKINASVQTSMMARFLLS